MAFQLCAQYLLVDCKHRENVKKEVLADPDQQLEPKTL